MKPLLTILAIASVTLAGVACKKHAPAPKPSLTSIYTKKLAGKHIWQSSVHAYSHVGIDTTYMLADDTFSIDILNDTSINVKGSQLNYFGSRFEDGYGFYINADTTNELCFAKGDARFLRVLRFKYHTNKVSFEYSNGGQGGWASYYYNTTVQ